MVDIVHIAIRGNLLAMVKSDGNEIPAYPTGHDIFVCEPVPLGSGGTTPPGGTGSGEIRIGPIPERLEAESTIGEVWHFGQKQLQNAADIILAVAAIEGGTRDAIRIALITAIIEGAGIWIHSNVGAYPESVNYPHDRDGSDADSVGIFQQRPSYGWGSVQECMETVYATRAFIGGPSGPNGGSPPGLFDIGGWQAMTPGEAAQAVQVSAFPDRYDQVVPVANAIMDALIVSGGGGGSGSWMWPFPLSYVLNDGSSEFGTRVHPITGEVRTHWGIDMGGGGIAGLPIPCAADGVVIATGGNYDGRGNFVNVQHADGSETRYFHMVNSPLVSVGDTVTMGQILGYVGTTGASTGEHLHFETLRNGEHMNPREFMASVGASNA